jgi:histidinol dehydrogenase
MDLADAEGLDAHRNAVKIRLSGLDLPDVQTLKTDNHNPNIETEIGAKSAIILSSVVNDTRVYIDNPLKEQP